MILLDGPRWMRCDVCGLLAPMAWPIGSVWTMPAGWTKTASYWGPGLQPDVCPIQDQPHAVARAAAIIVATPIGIPIGPGLPDGPAEIPIAVDKPSP